MYFEVLSGALGTFFPSGENAWKWLLALTSLALFLQFSFATKTHFVSNGEVPVAMKLLGSVSVLGLVSFLSLLSSTEPMKPYALLPFAISQLIFAWAKKYTRTACLTLAYSKDSPRALIDTGPYKWIRHPFYTSYLFYWAANALARSTLSQWAVFGVLCLIYIHAARFEERKFNDSPLQKIYAEYQARTTMLIPFVF